MALNSEEFEKLIDFSPDQGEIQRLTANHQVMKASFGTLVLAPIDLSKEGVKIFDSACADGTLIRDVMSSTSAAANKTWVGTDFNPNLFPAASTQPGNLTFQVQDITHPWPASMHSSFDLVHQRFALPGCGAFPIATAVKNMVQCVKPGGWIQLVEMDLVHEQDKEGVTADFYRLAKQILEGAGVEWDFASRLKQYLESAGCVELGEKWIDVRYGAMCGDPEVAKTSTWALKQTAWGLGIAAKKLPTSFTQEQLDALPRDIDQEMLEKGATVRVYAVWAVERRTKQVRGTSVHCVPPLCNLQCMAKLSITTYFAFQHSFQVTLTFKPWNVDINSGSDGSKSTQRERM